MARSTRARGRVVVALVTAEIIVCAALAVTGARNAGRRAPSAAGRAELVSALRLTDLALVSDASYCRHPTQADRFAPFSDHPGALEHFPAGSLVPPPERVARRPARRQVEATGSAGRSP